MYSQQEASALRQKFWVNFGKYMSPIPSSDGSRQNWINYRTGIKSIHFRMDATTSFAYIGIELSFSEPATRELYFNHFRTFKNAFEEIVLEKWHWEQQAFNNSGNRFARIYTKMVDVNILDENDWPKIISFLKTGMIALDKFWIGYRDIFEMLT